MQSQATPNASDRTLSFLYGPEHQRIKQNVALSGNGTSAYFSGNTWYLNGEDSLGLTYEKEVRTNGTTEHKHYVNAAGFTFALFTSRTGTLNGLPATTTSYFHKDHLGSVSVIADETGAVTERLAYDPWGKRRFINTTPGLSDKLDAIVGIKTDRGYTEHEHLDEVGVIHMNGRIYDPLMGRFMSADPTVQAPYNLKSFNRYSYVYNNPLANFDPTGFIAYQSASEASGESSSIGSSNFSWSSFFSNLFSSWGTVSQPESPDPQTHSSNGEVQVAFVLLPLIPGQAGGGAVAGAAAARIACDTCSSDNGFGIDTKTDEVKTKSRSLTERVTDFFSGGLKVAKRMVSPGIRIASPSAFGVLNVILNESGADSSEGADSPAGDIPASPAYPGNDPTVTPPDYEWRGRPGSKPGDKNGNYVNPGTGESLRPDLDHLPPVGPHWDHKDKDGNWGRIFPDGRREPKWVPKKD